LKLDKPPSKSAEKGGLGIGETTGALLDQGIKWGGWEKKRVGGGKQELVDGDQEKTAAKEKTKGRVGGRKKTDDEKHNKGEGVRGCAKREK